MTIFLSTPSARRATNIQFSTLISALFLSTPSARRATAATSPANPRKKISIHALREEGDLHPQKVKVNPVLISIHALREEGDATELPRGGSLYYFYPRPPRGGRRCGAALRHAARVISIHALREEGDLGLRYEGDKAKVFLSTPSARRATHQTGRPATRPGQFLSTPSARRATPSGRPVVYSLCNFYPRPPRGGRPTRLM